MPVDPAASAVANPGVDPPVKIVATEVLEEAHNTDAVMSCVGPAVNVPVAVNCCVEPIVTLAVLGVTAIEVNVAAITFRVVDPETRPSVAEMLVDPTEIAVANPPDAIVALVISEEAHVTDDVKFCVELSVYVPVAVNCCVNPAGTLGFAGVTAIEDSVAAVTVNGVEPETRPTVAVIVVEPTASVVASPLVNPIVATLSVPELHITELVMFTVELSE